MKLLLSLCFTLSLFACAEKIEQKSISKETNEISTPQPKMKKVDCLDGQFLHMRHIHNRTGIIRNDRNSRAYIDYEYNDLGKIKRITFRKDDSTYCNNAFIDFIYDAAGRLKKEEYLNSKGKEIYESRNYFYNSKNQVEKMVRSTGISKYGSERPGMVKYDYDKKGRITKESYFKTTGEPQIIGEMGIKFITYKYNENDQPIESIFHYTGTMKVEDPAKTLWLNEYIYDEKGVLTESRYKFDINDADYDNQTYFVYDTTNNLYDYGSDKEKLEPTIPYCDIKSIVYQRWYSRYFHTNPKLPVLENSKY